jgi:hypothetical protein
MSAVARRSWTGWSRAPQARRVARWLALRVLVLFAAMLVTLPSLAAQGNKYRCRFSGRVMDACCCKARAATSHVSASAEVRPADCCDTIRSSSAKVAASLRDVVQLATPGAPESTLALVPDATPTGSTGPLTRLAVQARAGPPIFLRDCRLLT